MTRSMLCHVAAALVLLCATVGRQAWQPVEAAGPADAEPLPRHLADTGLYAPDGSGTIASGNRLFSPQYPLWTDGMTKQRWIFLPPGTVIDAEDEHAWNFPPGTKLWKEFSHQGRKIETRLLWKAGHGRWVMASYVWNDDGTDAVLAPDDGLPAVVEVAPGRRHSIPSRSDCAACHGASRPNPLGFTSLQLSPDRDPGAIHGDVLRPDMVSLKTLVAEGLLVRARPDLLTNPPRIRTASPATRTVLGYLAANCAMCHNGNGEIAALGPVIRVRDLLEDGDAVAKSLIGQPTRWQIPGAAEGSSVLVQPGAADASAIVVRMRSRRPSSQMPPLGTVVPDREAIDRLSAWIRDPAR